MPEKAEATLPDRPAGARTRHIAATWPSALLWLVFFFALAFWLKDHFNRELHHPYLKSDTEAGVSVTILNYGTPDLQRCEKQVADMARAMQSACPVCKITERACKSDLSDEEYDWLSEAPLSTAAARSPEGVIIYEAATHDLALATCRLSEVRSGAAPAAGTLRCQPAEAERPYPTDQKTLIDAAKNNLQGVLILCASLGTLIVALIVSELARPQRSWLDRSWSVKLTLASFDVLVMLAAYAILGFPDFDEPLALRQFDKKNLLTHAFLVLITVSTFWVMLEHYTRRRPYWDELREIFRTLWVQMLLAGAAVFYLGLESGRGLTLITWASLFIALPLGRAAAKQLIDTAGLWKQPAVIVGTGENARDAYQAVAAERCLGYDIVGFIPTPHTDPGLHSIEIRGHHIPVLKTEDVRQTIDSLGNPQIIIAVDNTTQPEKQYLLRTLTSTRGNIHFIPSIRGLPLFGTQLSHFFNHDVLFLTVRNNLARRSYRWIKRGFDIIGAGLLLVIFAPLMAFVAWRIWREDGGPVIFRQPRVAKGGGEFGFLKFRSMVKNADAILAKWKETNSPEWQRYYANNFKLDQDPRVLSVGKWIRETSIDELPQLINVLRGEMSLVGPRPLLARELGDYGDSIRYYRQAHPGITGLWQISGRSRTTFSDRAMMDEWYVQNWSLWYDVAILFKTVDVVVKRSGAC